MGPLRHVREQNVELLCTVISIQLLVATLSCVVSFVETNTGLPCHRSPTSIYLFLSHTHERQNIMHLHPVHTLILDSEGCGQLVSATVLPPPAL